MHVLDMNDDELFEYFSDTVLPNIGKEEYYYYCGRSGRSFECVSQEWEGHHWLDSTWEILPIEESDIDEILELKKEREQEEMIANDLFEPVHVTVDDFVLLPKKTINHKLTLIQNNHSHILGFGYGSF